MKERKKERKEFTLFQKNCENIFNKIDSFKVSFSNAFSTLRCISLILTLVLKSTEQPR